jgi:ABC-type sulfate/molybdate transport systems ATPase subunit/ABC-type sulfate transport system permease component
MSARRVLWWAGGPLAWLGALVLLYLAIPVGAFLIRLSRSSHTGFSNPGLFGALWLSCVTATISVVIIALLGIPLAWVLARSRSKVAAVIGYAVYLPLAVPPLMAGILLIYVVGPYTPIGTFFGERLTNTAVGIVLAQTFVAAPFLIVSARAAFSAENPALQEVATALGHRPFARFIRVGVPVAAPGIRAGILLAWLRAFGEYGATVLLAYHPESLPVYTYVQFDGFGLTNTEAPTALALLVAAVVVTLGRAHLPRLRRRSAVRPPAVEPRAATPTPVAFDLDVALGTFHLNVAHRASTHRLAILGPSGSGKSLTLRGLAGLLGPRAGRVWYGTDRVDRTDVEERRIGYVPQGYELIPHLDAWSQVRFGVGSDPGLGAYWVETFHLDGLEHRLPRQLSGGQRQRVCLAQALARDPRLLLLDEPFSALDSPVRSELRMELRRLQRGRGLSSVVVTHDPEEAALLADEILVLLDGRLVQAGSPRQLHAHPASAEVARLLGIANILPGRVGLGRSLEAGGVRIGVPLPALELGAPVTWCIHPEHVEVSRSGAHRAEVVDVIELGAAAEVDLRVGHDLMVRTRSSDRRRWIVGSTHLVDLPSDAITVWPAPSRDGEPGVRGDRSLDARLVGPHGDGAA